MAQTSAAGKTQVIPLKKERKRIPFWYAPYGIDIPFLILLIAVLAVGLLSLASASYASAYYYEGNSYHYVTRQAIFAAGGLVAMLVISRVNYHILHGFAWIIFGISTALLVLVLILPPVQGVHRWIPLGLFSVQASEVGKFALILALAHLISKKTATTKKLRGGKALLYNGILPLALIGITAGLVLIETHLSGAILIACIGMIMWFAGGVNLPSFFGVGLAGLAGGIAYLKMSGHESDRITVWLDPIAVFDSGNAGRDQAWQTVQSLYAIGSGGTFGMGFGNSRQKHLFLPEPQNDFIFSITCEELGFIGATLILALFAALVIRGFYIGLHAPDRFGGLLAIGLSAQIGLQVILNVAVVSNLIPNTGISLPFFSYGGSSLVMLLMQMGVLLNISTQINRPKK